MYSNAMIECTTGCPEATIANPTINENDLAGAIYLDLGGDLQRCCSARIRIPRSSCSST